MPSSIYEQFWDAVYVEKALIEGGYNKGRAEGRVEGILETARKMKQRNIPMELIIETTGLTEKDIASL